MFIHRSEGEVFIDAPEAHVRSVQYSFKTHLLRIYPFPSANFLCVTSTAVADLLFRTVAILLRVPMHTLTPPLGRLKALFMSPLFRRFTAEM